jgi:hypothetical protein
MTVTTIHLFQSVGKYRLAATLVVVARFRPDWLVRNTMRSLRIASRMSFLMVVIPSLKVGSAFHHSSFVNIDDPSPVFHPPKVLTYSTMIMTRLQVIWDPHNVEGLPAFVNFPTSAQQIELKKEAKRRTARKQMPLFFFKEEEMNGPWSPETFQDVWNLLTKNEMITLKGICRNDRKLVHQTARWFCEELEDLISGSQGGDNGQVDGSDDSDDDDIEYATLPVEVLSYTGHSALIYCPTLSHHHPDKFRLHTSVGQKNVWTARPKPLRDDRGQIIK